MIRTFVAIELDDMTRQAIASLQTSLRNELQRVSRVPRLQWVKPESVHLTLKFLGDVNEETVPSILDALATAVSDQTAFSVEVQGVGVFPDARAPRVLWLGMSGATDRLVSLAGRVDVALEPLGFAREARPFTPHLTLARVKDGAREVGKALVETGILRQSARVGIVDVGAVSLMKSQLGPAGSVYTRLGGSQVGPKSP